jgi:hypothetical protein
MRSSPTIPPLFSRIWPQRAKALFPSADESSVALLSISTGNELDEFHCRYCFFSPEPPKAYHLAKREPKRPRGASLRRAVSTSYYALFHLSICEATRNWKRVGQPAALGRFFEHGKMYGASDK